MNKLDKHSNDPNASKRLVHRSAKRVLLHPCIEAQVMMNGAFSQNWFPKLSR